MTTQRALPGVLAAATLALASALTAGPAQAAPTVAGPSSSPAPARTELLPPGAGVNCTTGHFCASVWDPGANRFRVFYFYNCTRYYLSNWNGWGEAKNSQTGNATATLYGSGGNVLRTVPADNGVYAVDWAPVYSLRNC
ncbi:hypothetical protein [Streptomyces omiyaensis]|uniref:Peptidase inhibitor family I36 n=1 Tax=Streptomyces omiyaensis TaxID=68247 RepID=A0ABW7C4J2_9ACTN|nr:hypothetical protein [Streptomyces omiyaensis]GGY82043.1 hypothetical protein GCM10010363_73480 [Streptomyces omiyaensis]